MALVALVALAVSLLGGVVGSPAFAANRKGLQLDPIGPANLDGSVEVSHQDRDCTVQTICWVRTRAGFQVRADSEDVVVTPWVTWTFHMDLGVVYLETISGLHCDQQTWFGSLGFPDAVKIWDYRCVDGTATALTTARVGEGPPLPDRGFRLWYPEMSGCSGTAPARGCVVTAPTSVSLTVRSPNTRSGNGSIRHGQAVR